VSLRTRPLCAILALIALPAAALAGGSVYLDEGGAVIPYPTVVGEWGIFDVEVGPEYNGVGVEASVGHYLCTANFQAVYPEAGGYYLWSKSGNWDSIGLTVNHIKRVYDFLTDPVSWTETGAGQAARDKGMDDITQAGPTRCHASIGIEDLPVVPDFVSVSVGSDFWFNVNIHTGHDVVLDQYADIEQLNITNTAATFSVNANGTLRCRQGFNNAGTVFGPIQYIGGPGLTNSGRIQSAFGQVEGGLVNLPSGEIYCEGGSITGPVVNDGLFEVWEPTTIDTLSVTGGGSIVAKDRLTLRNSADPGVGLILEQPLTSHYQLCVDHPIQTPGASISAEGSVWLSSLDGTMSVLEGKSLTLWGDVGQNGHISVPAGSTLALPRAEDYVCNNRGLIQVFGTMRLAGPASFPYNWGGNTFNNSGQIDVIGGELIFSDFRSSHGTWKGPLMQGIGGISLSGGSRLVNPRIVAMGPVTIDAISEVIFNSDRSGERSLCGAIENNGLISVAADAVLGGPLVNNGSVENPAGILTYRGPWITGSGTIESTGGRLVLQPPTGTTDPVLVENTIISHNSTETPNSFTTTGAGHVQAGGRLTGGIGGKFSVLPGEYIRVYGSTFSADAEIGVDGTGTMFDWFTGTNEGLVDVTGDATLQTCGTSFNVSNSGTISVAGAAFNLPVPGSSSGYTGQVLTNTGSIDLDAGGMNFGCYVSRSLGAVIRGDGVISLRGGSVLRDPYLETTGPITIDATSRVEIDSYQVRNALIQGETTNNGLISLSHPTVFRGSLTNHGRIEVNGGTMYLQTPELLGTGELVVTGNATLEIDTPDGQTGPVTLHHSVSSAGWIRANSPVATAGGATIEAHGCFIGSLAGDLAVTPGEYLSMSADTIAQDASIMIDLPNTKLDWFSGTNDGLIRGEAGGTLQTKGASFSVTNAGIISLENAYFSLRGPGTSCGWSGQTFTNNGQIALSGSAMEFTAYNTIFNSYGPVITGSGTLDITKGSVVRNPQITGTQFITIDDTSSVEFNTAYSGTRVLEGYITNHGTITFNTHGTLAGNLINNGQIVMNGGNVTLRLPSLFGAGTIDSSATELTLEHPDGATPVEVLQSLTTRNRTLVPHGFTTSGNGIVRAAGYWQGAVGGQLEVLPGELLTVYGPSAIEPTGEVVIDGAGTKLDWQTGTNTGAIEATDGGTLQTRGASFALTNEAVIRVTDALFSLPVPGSSAGYTGQVLTNTGQILVDHSEMTFGYNGLVAGPVITGDGEIQVTNGSTLVNPKIVSGTLILDDTSSLECTVGGRALSDLRQSGHVQIDTTSAVAFYNGWEMLPGSSISTGPGWHYLHLYGDWINRIADPADFSLPQTQVWACAGTEDDPLLIEVCGQDSGDTAAGWEDNFCMVKLKVLNGCHVRLVDRHDNHPLALTALGTPDEQEALYLEYLQLEPGATLDVGTLNVYYKTLQGDPSQIIPEPVTLALLAGCGLPLLARSRRRR